MKNVMKKKLIWYWNRLRCMTPSEMGYRLERRTKIALQQLGLLRVNRVPAADLTGSSERWVTDFPSVDSEPYVAAADRILDGRLKVLAEDVDVGAETAWNRNPASGHTVPLAFGKTVNYRDFDLVGDIKYLWVLNRHAQILTIAQAYALTGEQRYLDGVGRHLATWFEQCPYLRGPNWTSSLELSIRLINWSFVWHLVGGKDSKLFEGEAGQALQRTWLDAIFQHAHFIRGHFSLHSSSNNHLIGEAAGLLIATVTWPFWPAAEGWKRYATETLIREIERQNTSDGVNREQAIFYQRFVLEFATLAVVIGRKNGVELPAACLERIEAMFEFLASAMDVDGRLPMIGDADECNIVTLAPHEELCKYRSLLAIGAVLFRRPAFRAKATRLDEGSVWLLGEAAKETFAALDPAAEALPVRRAFPEGGYYILGTDFETRDEVRMVADVGPLGYLSLAAHGHADALAFTLFVGGREFLVDPGTYAYQAKKTWRDYFRGTGGHNTIRIDGQDQSVMGGTFIWLARANATCRTWDTSTDADHLVGSHDGYSRLRDPVEHVRDLHFAKSSRLLTVRDTLVCKGSHTVEMCWHFSEDCDVRLQDGELHVQNGGSSLVMRPPADFGEVELIRGRDSPPTGWVSRDFDKKTPSTTVVVRGEIDGTRELTTCVAVVSSTST